MSTKKTQGDTRHSLLKGASLIAAAAAAFASTPALAQDNEEAIIVTGSRIPQPNLYTTSPVTQVTADDITTQGVTRVEDLTNQLPQVFASQGSNYSNGSTGTATVNLRGLGATRTLVLINGSRVPYGSPNATAADLNQIPGPLVERVEVLTGGASAVYGSDAIAGVVNFVMRDDFEGLRVDAQYGYYQHSNDSDDGFIREVIAARGATNPSQFQLPPDNVDDGFGKEATLIWGVSTDDNRGNITAYASYRTNDSVLQRDRDYSACTVADGDTSAVTGVPAGALHWNCGGSSTSYPGRFRKLSAPTISRTISSTTGLWAPFTPANQYNFGPLNYYQRPDERYSLGAFAHYQVNENFDAYGELMFSDYRSRSQIAPSGDFGNTATINCANPYLPSNTVATGFCSAADVSNNATREMYIFRRNVEGGGRQDDLNYESYRLHAGVRGQLNDSWDYDVSAIYARVNLSRTYENDFSVTRLNRALNVVDRDPGGDGLFYTGDDTFIGATCQSVLDGTDPGCVPYNVFQPNVSGSVTQAALDYLQIPLMQRGETIQQDAVATVTGEFPFHMPAAENNLSAAFGAEYRRDVLNSIVDTNFSSGDGAGQGGPTLPLSGSNDVFELFMEGRLPIVEGAAFADLLSLDFAYRYSDYATGITTDSYKIGAEWAPTQDLRFRGSYQRAVRAANVIELFTSQGLGLFDMTDDPCDTTDPGGNGVGLAAVCQAAVPLAYQVTPAQATGGGLDNSAGQYNGLFGGNPLLSPEEADTLTLGFVFQPSFVQGLNISVDYFDIEVTNLVSTTGAVNTVNDCYLNANLTSCGRITRGPGGTLWIGSAQVEDLNTNIGGLHTRGYDINANYGFSIGNAGDIGLALVGTFLDELTTDPGSSTGVSPYDCVGFVGGTGSCGTPNPEWRHRLRVSWETPWNFELDGTWRHYGEVKREVGAVGSTGLTFPSPTALDASWDSQDYFDLAGNWQLRENATVRFGVNNILDSDPPLSANVGAGAGNGNTFPQVYDALGRWIFAGITLDF